MPHVNPLRPTPDAAPDTIDTHRWQDDAACREVGWGAFFVEHPTLPVSYAKARAICARCPVRVECLEFALETNSEYGIWGGVTETERKRMRRERRGA